jgi:hypothetical protein
MRAVRARKSILYFLLIMSTQFTLYSKSAGIIIHGTWAKNELWYRPGGDFFHEIETANKFLNIVDEIISFSWSGKLGYPEQVKAAQNLTEKILEYDFVILIGHSHGVTVGILSSMILARNNSNGMNCSKIKKFYALGAPVDRESSIYPDMSVIDTFYNLFSFGDIIQPVHGLHERVLASHERITNIAIQIDDLHPTHSKLHHPAIAKHILAIPDVYRKERMGNFENFVRNHPAEILFYSYKFPIYRFQDEQEKLIRTDKIAFDLLQYAFFRSKKEL